MANRWFAGGCKRKLSASSNSGGLSSAELNSDKEEESPPNGAARPKLVPIPILSHALSNTSGLLILNTDEAVRYLPLGEVSLGFKPAGVFRVWRVQFSRAELAARGLLRTALRATPPPGPEPFLIRPSLYSSELIPAN